MSEKNDQGAPNHSSQTVPTHEIYCPNCDYDVRALVGETCPECGQKIDLVELRRSQIPWTYRRELGRFGAYWRTVRLVLFSHTRFGREISRPVDYTDAQRFRWVSILHAWLPLLAAAVALYVYHEGGPFDNRDIGGGLTAAIVGAVALLMLLFLLAVTGVHTYWFHPRSAPIARQNRAVALSYYAAAPLALTSLPVVMIMIGAWMLDVLPGGKSAAAFTMAGLSFAMGIALLILIPTWMWSLAVCLVRRAAQRGLAGQISLGIVLPLLWLILGALIFLGIPLVVGFVWLAIISLAE